MTVADTNILVHATAPSSPNHEQALTALERMRAQEGLAITRQILREYIAAVTRPQTWAMPASLGEATRTAEQFGRHFHILEDGARVWAELTRLGSLFQFGGKQVHDANIVATMLAHGERRLLTFNAVHFRRFDTLIDIVEP